MRRAVAEDALVVAALRLRAARAAGASTEPGFLDRFAAAWDPGTHPTWVAERDGGHAGVLIGQLVADLPWPGRGTQQRLHVVTLHAPATGVHRGTGPERDARDLRPLRPAVPLADPAVAEALTAAMTTWATGAGLVLTGAT